MSTAEPCVFSPIHIDAARNSTDDFNLFHDKRKWQRIRANPFGGPIVLGFQLECLIEDRIRHHRQAQGEQGLIEQHGLGFSNYQFTFANVVRPGQAVAVDIKKSQLSGEGVPLLSNRVVLKADGAIALIGHQRESRQPLCLAEADLSGLGELRGLPDRSYLPHAPYFLKRKFMNTGNAKNFLSGSLVEQADYFDELEDKVCFPQLFPVALISCALLERARQQRHAFETNPMVYTAHHITVDRMLTERLRSNDVLHLLVGEARSVSAEKGLGKSGIEQVLFDCFGLLDGNAVLFRAQIALAPLQEVLRSLGAQSRA